MAVRPSVGDRIGRDPRELVAVAVGGGIGALARAVLGLTVPVGPGLWPWPTFIANIVAAVLLGYVSTRLLERLPPSSYQRPLLGTGLCGGLSTFSTMQVETVRMLQAHAYLTAVSYTVLSLLAGFVTVHLSTAVVRRVRVRL